MLRVATGEFMKITEGIKLVGICANNFEETVSFFHKTMRLEIANEGVPTVDIQYAKYCVFNMPNDVMLEVLQPSVEIKGRYSGPVISFTVDDLDQACDEMEDKTQFITPIITDSSNWRWRYFQAPDNNIYQIQERLK